MYKGLQVAYTNTAFNCNKLPNAQPSPAPASQSGHPPLSAHVADVCCSKQRLSESNAPKDQPNSSQRRQGRLLQMVRRARLILHGQTQAQDSTAVGQNEVVPAISCLSAPETDDPTTAKAQSCIPQLFQDPVNRAYGSSLTASVCVQETGDRLLQRQTHPEANATHNCINFIWPNARVADSEHTCMAQTFNKRSEFQDTQTLIAACQNSCAAEGDPEKASPQLNHIKKQPWAEFVNGDADKQSCDEFYCKVTESAVTWSQGSLKPCPHQHQRKGFEERCNLQGKSTDHAILQERWFGVRPVLNRTGMIQQCTQSELHQSDETEAEVQGNAFYCEKDSKYPTCAAKCENQVTASVPDLLGGNPTPSGSDFASVQTAQISAALLPMPLNQGQATDANWFCGKLHIRSRTQAAPAHGQSTIPFPNESATFAYAARSPSASHSFDTAQIRCASRSSLTAPEHASQLHKPQPITPATHEVSQKARARHTTKKDGPERRLHHTEGLHLVKEACPPFMPPVPTASGMSHASQQPQQHDGADRPATEEQAANCITAKDAVPTNVTMHTALGRLKNLLGCRAKHNGCAGAGTACKGSWNAVEDSPIEGLQGRQTSADKVNTQANCEEGRALAEQINFVSQGVALRPPEGKLSRATGYNKIEQYGGVQVPHSPPARKVKVQAGKPSAAPPHMMWSITH